MSHFAIKEFFEALETDNVDMLKIHYMIEPIVNRNFGNTFHRHNGPNQCERFHKNTCQKYQNRSYQIPRNSSIPYLK